MDYNKIIERAREIYADPKEALKENVVISNEGTAAAIKVALLDLFPKEVIVEDEDERIRKELLNHCYQGSKQRTTVVNKEDYNRWIAWLERQKEKKNPLEDYSRGYNDGYYHGFTDNAKKEPENISASTMIPSCWETEQKEQKPAEHQCDCRYVGCHVNNCRRWCHKYNKEIPYDKCNSDCVGHFKNKPAEWSEEDTEMKLKILKYLSTRCSVFEFEEVENWLNNLRIRPNHWKPSEEQMKALWEVEDRMRSYLPMSQKQKGK